MKIFFNGSIIEDRDARLSVNDGGLLYGAGIFEIMRSCGGKVFAIADHLDRLFNSAGALGIHIPMEKAHLGEAVSSVLKANPAGQSRIRLTVTSGPMAMGTDEPNPTVLITSAPFEPYPAALYETGITVVLNTARQNPTDPTAGHQVLNYFPRLIALDTARRKMALEALWFTFENKLAEGSMSNIFIVKNGKLLTPSVNTPVVPGIVRRHVLAIAKANGIETIEGDLFITDLLEADEVFLTSTVMHILPVIKVESHAVKDSRPGSITAKLTAAFAEAFKLQTM
ncbi:MAG: hypothetical protein A2Y07_01425 [Planctomycetes bacterium GWF2_50_10]|nr:MAG: hypothetical protein A2Y07_01425 [Planctomycetes bacterium GWF2_50_10]